LTPAQMRDGMEALEITEAKMADLGLPNFGPEFTVSCENHGGNGFGAVAQWDAAADSWSLITDYIQSDQDVLAPLITEDAQAFAAESGIEPSC
ncbi:MAG TPA: ABC transporter permease, partial [Sulfitobacter pontiacus]|nr:ABC transporter permease [Sulfitobacter pontiacus]